MSTLCTWNVKIRVVKKVSRQCSPMCLFYLKVTEQLQKHQTILGCLACIYRVTF